jgi:hypothetical protein
MMPMVGGLLQALGNVGKINGYFEDLQNDGWEVDSSQSNQPSGFGAEVEAGTPMIWRARETSDDEWIDYVWTFGPRTGAAGNGEDQGGTGQIDFMAMMDFELVPRTEAALEVHQELGLPLPDDFELEPWDGGDGNGGGGDENEGGDHNGGGGKIHNGNGGDEDQGDDGVTEEENGDNGEGGNTEDGNTGNEHPPKGGN